MFIEMLLCLSKNIGELGKDYVLPSEYGIGAIREDGADVCVIITTPLNALSPEISSCNYSFHWPPFPQDTPPTHIWCVNWYTKA